MTTTSQTSTITTYDDEVNYTVLQRLLKEKGFNVTGENTGGGNITLTARKTATDTSVIIGPFYDYDAQDFRGLRTAGLKNDIYFGADLFDDEGYEVSPAPLILSPEASDTEVEVAEKIATEYLRLNA